MSLIHRWVRLYTSGLPQETKDRRRLEIESDLWEQRQDAHRDCSSHALFTAQILVRWLLGVPSDLTWRVAHGSEGGRRRVVPGGAAVGSSGAWKGFLAIGAVLAAFYLLLGVGTLAGRDAEYGVNRLNGLIPVGLAVLTAVGLWLRRWRSRVGIGLALLGAIPGASMTAWSFITPVLGVALLILGVRSFWAGKQQPSNKMR